MLQDLRKPRPFRGLSGRCHAHFPDIAISTPRGEGGGEGGTAIYGLYSYVPL